MGDEAPFAPRCPYCWAHYTIDGPDSLAVRLAGLRDHLVDSPMCRLEHDRRCQADADRCLLAGPVRADGDPPT